MACQTRIVQLDFELWILFQDARPGLAQIAHVAIISACLAVGTAILMVDQNDAPDVVDLCRKFDLREDHVPLLDATRVSNPIVVTMIQVFCEPALKEPLKAEVKAGDDNGVAFKRPVEIMREVGHVVSSVTA